MPSVKLSQEKVLIIKDKLRKGETHLKLAQEFGVSRPTITKINKSLKEPFHRDARWSHVDELDVVIFDEMYLPLRMRDLIRSLDNEGAGLLIKAICKKLEEK